MGPDSPAPAALRGQNPERITLIELMVLVSAVALVLPIPPEVGESWIEAAQVHEPWANCLRVAEWASKIGLALAAVILFRRVRSGTPFRAGEWLLLANAGRSLHWRLAMSGGMAWASRLTGWTDGAAWSRSWYALGMIGFVAVVAALVALRRLASLRWRLPLLACLPLFALWGPAILWSAELDVLWKRLWPTVAYGSAARSAYLNLMGLPEHLLVSLPFVATLRSLAKRGRSSLAWSEWAGLALGLYAAFGIVIMTIASTRMNSAMIQSRPHPLVVWVGCWLAELAVAWAIVRTLGLAWDRWVDPPARTPAADPS